ncbi:hypothetical protein FALBO_11206 [Fusarium albosuccineum]|uniref:Uncharacterized protein n=1 Tax=Fusarium albosuccineum TaxID=1237068 RepID=A0A8H4L679_9HYPO|nr:hypothetical protein FALBO_11206 [Fusarium albosuccineum]
MAAEPSDNPCRPGDGDDGGMANSDGGLARGSAPGGAPVTGSDTCRLFPILGSAPRFGRLMLPDVLTAQDPGDANGIEMDFRGNLDGVPSGDGVVSSMATAGIGRGSSWICAGGNKPRGADAVETILGFTR